MRRFLSTLLLSFVFLSFVSFAFAHGEASPSGDATATASGKSIEYTLAYPGLLADNPLYFLKAARDKVIEFLIADPVKKADFYLLQADKRLYEGKLLFDKGNSKYSLAETVVSKGENYFEKGIAQIQMAKNQNIAVDSLIQKYHLSSSKHEEVIKSMVGKSSGGVKSGLTQSQKRAHDFHHMLEDFEPQK